MKTLPVGVFDGIGMALSFLSFEELEPKDRPPREIWLNEEALKEHFDAVKARQKEEATDDGPIEDPVANPAAKDLIAR